MLKMSLLGASWGHLVAKARKRSKWAFWEPPGAIWWPGPENAQNEPSGSFLRPFGGQSPKTIKMGLLEKGHLILNILPGNS